MGDQEFGGCLSQLQIRRFTIIILLLLLALSPLIVYAQETNVGLLRIAKFQPPRQVAPNSVFSVSLDVEYAVHEANASVRSAIYLGPVTTNESSPLWRSPVVIVTGGGDLAWNVSLTAPANEGVMQLTAFAYYLNGGVWQYYNDSFQGPGYEQLSVKVARTANLEIDLGAAGLQITVANSTQQTSDSGSASIKLPVDQTYNVSVPTNVELKNATMLVFSVWSDGTNTTARSILLDGDVKIAGFYRHQYLLQVASPVPAYSYSKWCDAGSNVTLRVNSTVPFSSPLDLLGLKYVFQGWTGDVNSQLNQVNVTMNSPKSIDANFSVDYRPLVFPAILAAGIIGAVILTMLRRKRTPMNLPSETSESTQETDSATETLCGSCGKPVEKEWKHCIHCGADLPAPSPVNE